MDVVDRSAAVQLRAGDSVGDAEAINDAVHARGYHEPYGHSHKQLLPRSGRNFEGTDAMHSAFTMASATSG